MADKRISQLIERVDIANNDVLPIVASGATTTNKVTISTIQDWMQENLDVGVTSVGLSMPSAFVVSNSPVTASGNISVTGAGTVGQYIRGDGSLADFPANTGGGSSVSYYLNGSVSQGTIGGIAYTELSKTPILGAGTDFTISADGYIASFITDAGDPGLLEIPAGNWNFETYFQASSGGGTPSFYIELYKVNSGGTATLIASNSATPELIAFGTSTTPYFSALAVPQTVLTLTDRLAIRYYVAHSGRTITLHTENATLCQVITTFTSGITALNGLTAQVQNFATGTSGTDFNISSAGSTHTFNIPSASATDRGLVTTGSQTIAGAKTFSDDAVINGVRVGRGSGTITSNTIVGENALNANTTGNSNTAIGQASMVSNTTGASNTAVGRGSLEKNTTAIWNCGIGTFSLFGNTTGSDNIAFGNQAGAYIANGSTENSITNNSVFLGGNTKAQGNNQTNQIVIGHNAIGNGSNTVTIGNSSITDTYLKGAVRLSDTGTSSSIIITSDSTGSGAIDLTKNTTGTGIRITNNGVGEGILALNNSTGSGITIGNISTGKGLIIANAAAATGDPFVYTLGGAAFVKAKIDYLGNLTANQATLTGALSGTSASFSGDISVGGTLPAWDSGWNVAQVNTASLHNVGSFSQLANNIYYDGTNYRFITSNGASRIGFNTDGEVFIGTVGTGSSGGIATLTQRLTINGSTGAATFSGALNGTSASFSSTLTASKGTFNGTTSEPIRIERFVSGSAVGRYSLAISGAGNFSVYDAIADSDRLIIAQSTGAATFSSSVSLGTNANAADTASLNIKQAGTSYNQGIYIERGGERNGYHMYIGGALDSLTFRRNYFGTQSDVMSLTRDANVGIGTPSPNEKLDVEGNFVLRNSGTYSTSLTREIIYRSSTASYGVQPVANIVFGTTGDAAGDIRFVTRADAANYAERMRITSGGNVGIGVISPTRRLQVEAAAIEYVFVSQNTRNTSGDLNSLLTLGNNANNTSSYFLVCSVPAGDRMYIYGNGNIVNTNNSYGSLSDAKIKENIEDATPKLDDLMKVKVRNYNLIGDDKKQIGVIAQELEEVFPAMVDESEDFDEVEVPKVDEEGNEILNEKGEVVTTKERVSKGTTTKSVKYSVFVPMLIKAMQEQQEQIKSLTEQVEALKSQING